MKALFFDGQRRHRKDLPQPMPRGEEALMRPGRWRIVKSTLAAPLAVSPVPLVVEEMVIIGSPWGPFARAIAALAGGEIHVVSWSVLSTL